MISLVQRFGKLSVTTFALALAIWIFSASSALASGGHGGGGGHMGGGGHAAGGFSHHGFNNFGGAGFYPGYYGYGYGLGYDGYGFGYGYPYYGGYGASYGYPSYGYGNVPIYGITNGYGYGSTYYNAGFVGAALGFGN
jgi:hypothetical protein